MLTAHIPASEWEMTITKDLADNGTACKVVFSARVERLE